MARSSRGGRKSRRNITRAHVYIHATFNNTIVTVTDPNGDTLAWASGGTIGYKGSKKSTPYAARLAAEQAARKAMDMGVREIDIFINGPGPGREAALRALHGMGLKIRSITDVTPVPHNGCKPPSKRRV
ncbi:MAG: 30S ribosomal protein S11 [Anaerolineae bacterium]|nr:30S ribosomal protein S11 [Thermoflexus sp.]MDW8064991.1 30S ribosomal protein S11 [Anaerolineae bacterium]